MAPEATAQLDQLSPAERIKVTNGFRSEWGAQACADLQSVMAIAKRKGQKVFGTLIGLMGCQFFTSSKLQTHEQ